MSEHRRRASPWWLLLALPLVVLAWGSWYFGALSGSVCHLGRDSTPRNPQEAAALADVHAREPECGGPAMECKLYLYVGEDGNIQVSVEHGPVDVAGRRCLMMNDNETWYAYLPNGRLLSKGGPNP